MRPTLSNVVLILIILLLVLDKLTWMKSQTAHPEPKGKERERELMTVAPQCAVPIVSPQSVSKPTTAAPVPTTAARPSDCPDKYIVSHLLSQFLDIDLTEFVLGTMPAPSDAPFTTLGVTTGLHKKRALSTVHGRILDIGVFEPSAIINAARRGFEVDAYEAEPGRFKLCHEKIQLEAESVQNRIKLHMEAVTDIPPSPRRESTVCVKSDGVDSHIFWLRQGEQSAKKQQQQPCTRVKTAHMETIVRKRHEEVSQARNTTTVSSGKQSRNTRNRDQKYLSKFSSRYPYYLVKIDAQGFDTRLLDSLMDAIDGAEPIVSIPFIQFEFTPVFEKNRGKRTLKDHRAVFRRLIDMGYDLYQGATLQPWNEHVKNSLREHFPDGGPLVEFAMDGPDLDGVDGVPTCLDSFLGRMHQKGSVTPNAGGSATKTTLGRWMDILAVKRLGHSPYSRNKNWMLSQDWK